MPARYLNLVGRITYEVDPQVGGGQYTWQVRVDFADNDDPLLQALLARVRADIAQRIAATGTAAPMLDLY